MPATFNELLVRAVDASASDIHLKVGSPPTIRVNGELKRMEDLEPLTPSDTEGYAAEVLTERAGDAFKEKGEADLAYGRHDVGRFRVNVFRQRGSVSLVLRRVTPGVPSLDRLGLPPIVKRFASERRGLVLVTGPAGSGRTTTLAGMVDHINGTFPVSIVTVEDPIEVLFPDKIGSVAQREVGVDTAGFSEAIHRASRQDADVVMVSEIADHSTAAAVLAAAETGQLVMAAMRTTDPGETVRRLIDFFPVDAQAGARIQIAAQLKGVVSQRLIETEETGTVLAAEVLMGTGKVSELIVNDAPTEAILELIKESEFFGMQTFDQALLGLVKSGRLTVKEAVPHVRNSHEFRAKAMEAGLEV